MDLTSRKIEISSRRWIAVGKKAPMPPLFVSLVRDDDVVTKKENVSMGQIFKNNVRIKLEVQP